MRAAIVPALVVLIISVLGTAAQAADHCLTKTEARALYRTSYLYWRGQDGKRCWSSRRGGGGGLHRPSRQAVPVSTPAPPPFPIVIPAQVGRELSILDHPQWAWVAEARAAAHDDDLPYSTFALGAEPEIWPRLPEPANAAGMIIVVMSGILAMALGLALWRWRLTKLAINR